MSANRRDPKNDRPSLSFQCNTIQHNTLHSNAIPYNTCFQLFLNLCFEVSHFHLLALPLKFRDENFQIGFEWPVLSSVDNGVDPTVGEDKYYRTGVERILERQILVSEVVNEVIKLKEKTRLNACFATKHQYKLSIGIRHRHGNISLCRYVKCS